MTTRTREKRRRRKALARWRERRWVEDVFAHAREQVDALALDAFIFGRHVVEHGADGSVRRVPPSEWPDSRLTFDAFVSTVWPRESCAIGGKARVVANPPHPDGAIARARVADRPPDFKPIDIKAEALTRFHEAADGLPQFFKPRAFR